MDSSKKTILITGATGKQGGAVINALIAGESTTPPQAFDIVALTRDPLSSAAQALASKPQVRLIQGDLNDPKAIFEQLEKVWGVFSVQVPSFSSATPPVEEVQGCGLVDAAMAAGVKYFVYTSVDRGGAERSDHESTDIPHFKCKFNIEKHLKTATAAASPQKMEWTILRPTAFFDNIAPGLFSKVFGSAWSGMGDKRLQFISCKDIGVFAARAFREPERYSGRSISLAGDELSYREAAEVFKDEMGIDMPTTWGFVGSMIKWAVDDIGKMFRWFEEVGYGADIQALRKEYPELQDLRKWLRESSKFEKQ
jgi:uncharacterized protein YbjT (DUF2867 family)